MQVTIRPLVERDAYTSYKWRNDPEVFRYTGNTYDHEITLESELDWISRIIAKEDDYRCAILVDGLYVGNIYLTGINGEEAEYHIFIGNRNYWGKGVAKAASNLIIKYGFDKLNLSRIYLEVNINNISAFQLYEKLGFVTKTVENDRVYMLLEKPRRETYE